MRETTYGPEGRGFESLTAYHPEPIELQWVRDFYFDLEFNRIHPFSNTFLTAPPAGVLSAYPQSPVSGKYPSGRKYWRLFEYHCAPSIPAHLLGRIRCSAAGLHSYALTV